MFVVLTRQYSSIEANVPLKPDTSCSQSVFSKRPGPWLQVHWDPSRLKSTALVRKFYCTHVFVYDYDFVI